jgi:hypothetical protein
MKCSKELMLQEAMFETTWGWSNDGSNSMLFRFDSFSASAVWGDLVVPLRSVEQEETLAN